MLLSTVTSIILLGHCFVPHHHAEEHHHDLHSGHSHSGHDHDEGTGIKNLFANHCHSSECFTTTQKTEVGQSVHQQILNDAVAVILPVRPAAVANRPVQATYASGYVYSSPHLVHLDFRGPPATV